MCQVESELRRRSRRALNVPLPVAAETNRRGALYQQTAERLPVGHIGDVTEPAEAYLYLMRQTYSTGQVLVVDGGAVLV
jgi:NAD(P)-dependent dehydrogenase (short-subunit alcohol dehydrogenase family)